MGKNIFNSNFSKQYAHVSFSWSSVWSSVGLFFKIRRPKKSAWTFVNSERRLFHYSRTFYRKKKWYRLWKYSLVAIKPFFLNPLVNPQINLETFQRGPDPRGGNCWYGASLSLRKMKWLKVAGFCFSFDPVEITQLLGGGAPSPGRRMFNKALMDS